MLRTWLALGLLRIAARVRRGFIGPHGAAVLAVTENGRLLVPATDMVIGRKLCFSGQYDKAELDFLRQTIDQESRVLVVGAHVGALAIPLAKAARQVIAVEANPATFDLLRMNVGLNGLANVDLYNVAAGDRAEPVEMLANRLNTGGSKLKVGGWNRWIYTYDKPGTVTVPMRRLDDLFPEDRFDLIVLDIEGSELMALRGMRRLLASCRFLMIEITQHHLRNIARVADTELLGFLEPHFQGAFVFADHARRGAGSHWHPRSGFAEMLTECRERGSMNVLFESAAITCRTNVCLGSVRD